MTASETVVRVTPARTCSENSALSPQEPPRPETHRRGADHGPDPRQDARMTERGALGSGGPAGVEDGRVRVRVEPVLDPEPGDPPDAGADAQRRDEDARRDLCPVELVSLSTEKGQTLMPKVMTVRSHLATTATATDPTSGPTWAGDLTHSPLSCLSSRHSANIS